MSDPQLFFGDCLDILPLLDADSIDAVVTDPPYGLGFMGKDWDYGVPGEHFWREILRIAKPGAHLLAFGGTRTFHRLTVAIEDAGWEIRDCVMWVYGSGFPKSKNLGNGWGTALKPAWEPIIVARKALNGTVTDNVSEFGTGAINIDASRVATGDKLGGGNNSAVVSREGKHEGWKRPWMEDPNSAAESANRSRESTARSEALGRWPANLIHDGSDEVVSVFPQSAGQLADVSTDNLSPKSKNVYGRMNRKGEPSADSDNNGTVGFKMKPGVRRLDNGSAARFFYCAKASKSDRDEGMDDSDDRILARSCQAQAEAQRGHTVDAESGAYNKARIRKNNHPTVKPTDLMRYLCRLVTPVSGIILDPFMGSGSTGKAAILEGFDFMGIEKDEEAFAVAETRIQHAVSLR